VKLAIGTVQFGLNYGIANREGQVDRATAVEILKIAGEHGIDTLDTAIAYGNSEQSLGDIGVQGFKVVTKLSGMGPEIGSVEQWVRKEVTGSMGRLGVSRLYGLLLHRSENLLGSQGKELANTLRSLKDEGFVEKVGVSIYSPEELDRIEGVFQIDLIQAPLNLIDRRLETSGWLDRLKTAGVEVHSRSTFLQGLLLLNRAELPPKFDQWNEIWNVWHSRLESENRSAVQECLGYPMGLENVDKVVVGVDNPAHLAELIAMSTKRGTQQQWSFMQSENEMLVNPSKWAEL